MVDEGNGTRRSGAPADPKSQGPARRSLQARPSWLVLLILFAANWMLMKMLVPKPSYVNVPYTFFKQQVQAGNVETVISEGDAIQGTFKKAITYPPPEPKPTPGTTAQPEAAESHTSTKFKTRRPAFADPGLETLLEEKGAVINAVEETQPLWQSLLLGFGPTLLLIGGFVWLSQRAAGSAGGLLGIGRSRAKRYVELQSKVSFKDAAGIDEAKDELIEVVDFLKNPAKYQRLGGSVPKGVLLVGAPGTGKTLLARAVAGEAGVPFFSMSASGFIEMIVGAGAARVRDLFKQAREAAPSIIFIDELDAVGRARGGVAGGAQGRKRGSRPGLLRRDGEDRSRAGAPHATLGGGSGTHRVP